MRSALLTAVICMCAAVPDAVDAQTTCPEPPNKLSATVNAAVTFDPTANLYTYSYTVLNSPASEQEISDFAVDLFGAVSGVQSPRGWLGDLAAERATVMWHAHENADVDPDEPDDGGTLPGLYQVKPGEVLGGFEFKSAFPPLPVNFYAVGYVDVPTATSEEEAETMLEECPESTGGFFDMAFVGITSGPVQLFESAFVVSETPEGSAATPQRPASAAARAPGGPQAAVELWEAPAAMPPSEVAVLGTRDFDGRAIRAGSVKIGERILTDLHGSPHVEDVNDDGTLDLVIHAARAAIDANTVISAQLTSGARVRATRVR